MKEVYSVNNLFFNSKKLIVESIRLTHSSMTDLKVSFIDPNEVIVSKNINEQVSKIISRYEITTHYVHDSVQHL